VAVDKHYPTDPSGVHDAGAVARKQPCTLRTWCLDLEGHAPPCTEAPRYRIEIDDLGPGASKRRRW